MEAPPTFESNAPRKRVRRPVLPPPDLYQVLLRELRTKLGLRQRQVAQRVGKPQSFVSKYENGERRLDVSELRMVCHAMGMSLPRFVFVLERSIREGVPVLERDDLPIERPRDAITRSRGW